MIANYLNERGVLSPDAGRARSNNGVKHVVSGRWNPNTVKSLCTSPIITGMFEYGVRSVGKHRRLSEDGSRAERPDERRGDKSVRVQSPKSLRILSNAHYESAFSRERFAAIQQQVDERARKQHRIRPKIAAAVHIATLWTRKQSPRSASKCLEQSPCKNHQLN